MVSYVAVALVLLKFSLSNGIQFDYTILPLPSVCKATLAVLGAFSVMS